MADWPNVLVPNKISTLLDYVKRVNKPTKITVEWLVAAGFTSTNDRALIGLLKALGYLDASGAPTDKWAELKGADGVRAASVGRQMEVAYPEVFGNWPVAFIRDSLSKDDLKNFIRPKISAGDATVGNIVATFFALRALASFDTPAGAVAPMAPVGASANPAVGLVPSSSRASGRALNVTINLSLEIPATNDPDIYDKLFWAMAKHLGPLVDRGTGD